MKLRNCLNAIGDFAAKPRQLSHDHNVIWSEEPEELAEDDDAICSGINALATVLRESINIKFALRKTDTHAVIHTCRL